MMQVKKYRAATTREALEQIKQDLGDDAFVLETRRVKSGGFLGLGAQMQIEISAANPARNAKSAAAESKTKQLSGKLNLTDDTPAAPISSSEKSKDRLMSALFSRKEENDKEKTASPAAAAKYGSFLNLDEPSAVTTPKIETVEISTELPRIVHTKKEASKPIVAEPPAAAATAAAAAATVIETTEIPAVIPPAENSFSTSITNRELNLLRAELREVKFSLGMFSNRQNIPVVHDNIGLDMFSEVLDPPFYEAFMQLTDTGISTELARQLISEVIPAYKESLNQGRVKLNRLSHAALLQNISSLIKFEVNPLEQMQPVTLAVIGATGVGKTTTVAKLAANVALRQRRRVELVTLDTYRIAAVEQLKTYAEIIGANCHVVRSVFELDAVLRRLPEDATVLIDTTGKNPHDLADQYELADYLKGREEIRKCLAVQATTNLYDGQATIKKFEIYGADCLALTKLDETSRPGAMLELISSSSLPLSFLCAGQRVPEDLQTATAENFASRILSEQL